MATSPLTVSAEVASAASQVADDAIQVLKATAVDGSTVVAEALAGFDDPSSDISGVQKMIKAIAIGVARGSAGDEVIDWTVPALINSWEAFPAPYSPVGYMRDSQRTVHVRGIVAGGYLGAAGDSSGIMFVLPTGCRPEVELLFLTPCDSTESSGTCAQVRVQTDGTVRLWSSFFPDGTFGIDDSGWVSLTLSFRADQ